MDEPKDVRFGILPPSNLNLIGDIPKTLLDSCRAPGVHPEDPCLRRWFPDSIGNFNSELGLFAPKSARVSAVFMFVCLYLPDPTQADQRRSRRRQSAFLRELINRGSAINEVGVPPKGDIR